MVTTRAPWRAAVVIVAALGLAGCGGDDSSGASTPTRRPTTETTETSETTSTSTGAPSSTIGELDVDLASLGLVTDGTLTICSATPYVPFEFTDDASGNLTGFDVDLLAAISEELGATTKWRTTPFDSILVAVTEGECDLVASALPINAERAETVDFTDPYFDADQSLLVRATDAVDLADLDDLVGRRVGVQSGAEGETYAAEHLPDGAEVVAFETGDEMFPALASGDIDAVVQDLSSNGYQATLDDQLVVAATFTTGEHYGFAVAKGDVALADALNAALAKVKADGVYDEIVTTWFG